MDIISVWKSWLMTISFNLIPRPLSWTNYELVLMIILKKKCNTKSNSILHHILNLFSTWNQYICCWQSKTQCTSSRTFLPSSWNEIKKKNTINKCGLNTEALHNKRDTISILINLNLVADIHKKTQENTRHLLELQLSQMNEHIYVW